MKTGEAIRRMIDASGQSMRQVSTALGRTANYVSATLVQGGTPKATTLASIADVCGYDLRLDKRDGTDTIIIDAPEKE